MLGKVHTSAVDFIKGRDMFGHTITFNFDRKGETHHTIVGGLLSVAVKALLTFYVIICVKRLILHERDSITTTLMANDIDFEGAGVDYLDLNMTIFWVLEKQEDNAEPLATKTDLHEYIDYYFIQEEADWNKPANEGRFENRRIEAR